MFVYICDHVLDDMIESLARKVEEHYVHDGKTVLPDFVAVGASGEEIVKRLLSRLSKKGREEPRSYCIPVGEKGKAIQELLVEVQDRSVLICDGIVNTGNTLQKTRRHMLARNPKDVKTLTVVLKNDSKLIPNFYAMVVDAHDEVFFGRKSYPVRFYPKGCIRLLDQSDSGKILNLDVHYLSGCLDDYIYYVRTNEDSKCYVVEEGLGNRPVGLLYFRRTSPNDVFVDAIAVDVQMRGMGIASSMLEYLDNYCQFNKILRIRMLAISTAVTLYEKFGYTKTGMVIELSNLILFEMEYLI